MSPMLRWNELYIIFENLLEWLNTNFQKEIYGRYINKILEFLYCRREEIRIGIKILSILVTI